MGGHTGRSGGTNFKCCCDFAERMRRVITHEQNRSRMRTTAHVEQKIMWNNNVVTPDIHGIHVFSNVNMHGLWARSTSRAIYFHG